MFNLIKKQIKFNDIYNIKNILNISFLIPLIQISNFTTNNIQLNAKYENKKILINDDYFLKRTKNLKNKLFNSPNQSFFKVMCSILYTDHSHQFHCVDGTNGEQGYIGGAICGERAALLELRKYNYLDIHRVYIVTDGDHPFPPGPLCREYLSSHMDRLGYIVYSGENLSNFHKISLKNLYPFTSIYSTLNRHESLLYGEKFAKNKIQSINKDNLLKLINNNINKYNNYNINNNEINIILNSLNKLMNKVQNMVLKDNRNDIHPMKYGAAILFNDGTIYGSYEKKSFEYGCSIDSITSLNQIICDKNDENIKPLIIIQMDQFGILHAPFAPARAFLVEHGFGDVKILMHKKNGELELPSANILLPYVDDLSLSFGGCC